MKRFKGIIKKIISRSSVKQLQDVKQRVSQPTQELTEVNTKRPAPAKNFPFTIDVGKTKSFDELSITIENQADCQIPNFKSTALNLLKKDFRESLPALGLIKLENVYVFGSGFLMTEDRKRVTSKYLPYTNVKTEKGIKLSSGSVRSLEDDKWRTRPLNIIEVNKPTFLMTQPGDTIFGHWLVDLIPMFSMFRQTGIQATPIVKRSVLAGKSIPDIQGIFELIGFDRTNALGLTENLEAFFCKELYVPTVVRYGQQIHPFSYNLFERYRLAPNESPTPKKVYFSRRLWTPSGPHRVLRNAEEIEQFYSKKGFEIIHPESLSFSEKMNIIRNAEEVVGEKGTALHLTQFSRRIKKVTVLLNPTEAMTGLPLLQGELCRLQGVKCDYIVGDALANNQGYTIQIA